MAEEVKQRKPTTDSGSDVYSPRKCVVSRISGESERQSPVATSPAVGGDVGNGQGQGEGDELLATQLHHP